MDDSIYLDFYRTRDQIEIWWVMTQPHLVSDAAIHVYVALASFIALGLSLAIAFSARNRLRDLRLEAFDIRIPGRPPSRQKAIEKRVAEIKRRTSKAWRKFVADFFLLLVFGLCIPATGLFLLCVHYTWLDASGIAFIDLHQHTATQTADPMALTGFVINQMSHGALLDFPEVFDIDFGRLTSNPSNLWFSSLVLLFRTIVGGFTLALVIAIRDTLWVLWKLRAKTEQKLVAIQANAAIPA